MLWVKIWTRQPGNPFINLCHELRGEVQVKKWEHQVRELLRQVTKDLYANPHLVGGQSAGLVLIEVGQGEPATTCPPCWPG